MIKGESHKIVLLVKIMISHIVYVADNIRYQRRKYSHCEHSDCLTNKAQVLPDSAVLVVVSAKTSDNR